jgi:hypothetical protein
MSSSRKASIAIGALFIIGTVCGALSQAAFWEPVHGAGDLLAHVAANGGQVVLGAVFWLAMGLALAFVPIAAFPILRRHNETLAVGYVVFRGGLETLTYAASAVSWLLLLPLGRTSGIGVAETALLPVIGKAMFEVREIMSISTIVFCIGSMMFFWVLFRSRLIPRWLSLWGLVAAVPYITGGALGLVGAVDPWAAVVIVIDIPLAIQEMVLAVWLIVKGFDASTA